MQPATQVTEATGRPPDGSSNMDTDGFMTPLPIGRKRGRGRPPGSKNKPKDSDVESIISENSFSSLNDDDLGETDHATKRFRKLRQPKPPPLIIPNLNFKDVEKKLSGLKIPKTNVNRRIVEGTTTKLYVTTCDEHRLLREHLNHSSTKYITFTPPDERLIRFVMYGLPDHDVNEVKKDITEKLHVAPSEVKKMKITKKKYAEQANYLIYFEQHSNVTINNLKSVRGILGYHVFFERYKRDGAPTQCFNCQKYTHASKNCTMDPLCNRCGGPHKSKECDKVDVNTGRVPDEKLKCSNCHGNHTASSMNCPVRMKMISERQALAKQKDSFAKQSRYVNQYNDFNKHFPSFNKNKNNTSDVNQTHDMYTQNVSYANAARIDFRVADKRSNSNLLSPKQLMEIFKEMIRICSTCQSKEQQLMALSDVVEKYVLND